MPHASRPYMPGYGIAAAAAGKGLLPWSWAAERLAASRNYWVATTRPDGAPHVMAVWGLWLDDVFLFSTGARSRKARNLARDPRCVVTTEGARTAVIVQGVADIVHDAAQQRVRDDALLRRFIDQYKRKYDWDMTGDEGPIFRVRPRVAFAFIETAEEDVGDFASTATRWTFDA